MGRGGLPAANGSTLPLPPPPAPAPAPAPLPVLAPPVEEKLNVRIPAVMAPTLLAGDTDPAGARTCAKPEYPDVGRPEGSTDAAADGSIAARTYLDATLGCQGKGKPSAGDTQAHACTHALPGRLSWRIAWVGYPALGDGPPDPLDAGDVGLLSLRMMPRSTSRDLADRTHPLAANSGPGPSATR